MNLFRPAREAAKAVVVADLDKLVSEQTAFRWDGKVHVIKPLATETFFKVCNELSRMQDLAKREALTAKELVDAYSDLFASICDTIHRKDVESMSQAQVGALFQLVIDSVAGKSQVDEKKKTLVH
jgi:hypothetical protein